MPACLAVVVFRSTLIGPMPLRLLIPPIGIVLIVYAAGALKALSSSGSSVFMWPSAGRAGVSPL